MNQFLAEHEVTSVQREGHGGKENGELLDCLEGHFDVFVLADKNLRYQQNLTDREIAIVELPTNRWPLLKSIETEIRSSIESAIPGSYIVISSALE